MPQFTISMFSYIFRCLFSGTTKPIFVQFFRLSLDLVLMIFMEMGLCISNVFPLVIRHSYEKFAAKATLFSDRNPHEFIQKNNLGFRSYYYRISWMFCGRFSENKKCNWGIHNRTMFFSPYQYTVELIKMSLRCRP